jgi:single-stranded-DNA-specific exonuclease
VRPVLTEITRPAEPRSAPILDWRQTVPPAPEPVLRVDQAPVQWSDWQAWQRQAAQTGLPLALAFPAVVDERSPQQVWQELVGIAKYLARTQTPVTRKQLGDRLQLSAPSLALGLVALATAGFEVVALEADTLTLQAEADPMAPDSALVQRFLEGVQEEQFRRRYFAQVPVTALSW